jgi:hypothetical protein
MHPLELFFALACLWLAVTTPALAGVVVDAGSGLSRPCPRERNISLHINTMKAEDTGYCFCFYMALWPGALLGDIYNIPVGCDLISVAREPCSNEYLAAKADCSKPLPPIHTQQRLEDVSYRNGSWIPVEVNSWGYLQKLFSYEWRGAYDCSGLEPEQTIAMPNYGCYGGGISLVAETSDLHRRGNIGV